MTAKRILAYIIDTIIVIAIVSLFSKIEILNPNAKEYDIAIANYYEVYEDYMKGISNNASVLDQIVNELTDISYDVSKYSITINILNLLVISLYFIVFQYFNNGQTVGKRIMGIKIVNNKNERPSFAQIFLRSIIIYGIVTEGISLTLLATASKEVYLNAYSYLSVIQTTLIILTFLVMLFREDKKGFHDLVAKTNVINTKPLMKELKEK